MNITNAQLAELTALLPWVIPIIAGIVIPFLVNLTNRYLRMSPAVQSFIYFALSSLAAVIPLVSFEGDVKGYFIALGVAWLTSMRIHYTTIPNTVIPPYKPRHALDPDRVYD